MQSAFAKTWGVRPVTIVAAGLVAVVLLAVSWARPQFWGEMGSVPAETTKLNLLAD